MLKGPIDDKTSLVQIMAWCWSWTRQVASHCLANAEPVHWHTYASPVLLTHCGQEMPHGDIDLGQINIGSDNGFLPNSTKPLPEPMVTYHQWRSVDLRPISKEELKFSIPKMTLKNILVNLLPHLSGANQLTVNSLWPSDAIWQQIWVNTGSGNGLLPDGTKPLPKSMLTHHQWSPVTFILGQFHKRCLNHQSLKSLENYISKI